MKKIMRLQTKIIFAILSAVIFFTAVQGILFYTVVERLEDDITNEWVELVGNALVAKVDASPNAYVRDQKIELLPNLTMWIGSAPGLSPKIVPLKSGIHELTLDGSALHIYISEAIGEKIWIVYDASVHEKKVTLVGYVLISIFVLSIILAWLLSKRISRKVLNTFEIVLKYIRHWGTSRQNELESDDTTKLLQSFDSLEKQLSHLFLSEQQMLVNVNHEIRGFLTHIRMEAELIAVRPSLEQAHIRAKKIIEKVDEVRAVVEVLLGKSNNVLSREEVSHVPSMIQDLWQMLCFIHERQHAPELMVQEISEPQYHGDRYALLLIIRNLLDNVILHAQATKVEIELHAHQMLIKDNGVGLSLSIEQLKEHHWKRSDIEAISNDATSQASYGVGLSIAYTVALKNNWKLLLVDDPENGWNTIIRIDFNEMTE